MSGGGVHRDSLNPTRRRTPTPGESARIACIAEVTAQKAGNVHPEAPFDDVAWVDFVVSAAVCAPLLDTAASRGIGRTVLACVEATRQAVASNTNLGILLLLAPLCAVPPDRPYREGVGQVLRNLTRDDAVAVYAAIRAADPGGLGRVRSQDVAANPDAALVEAMRLAAKRDAVARQYVTSFEDVFRLATRLGVVAPPLDGAIVHSHLEQMAREPDSLIRRKCGDAVAGESQRRAAAVLEAGWPESRCGAEQFADLDRWLRLDGHRRNPGTSADLVTSGLFVALRDGSIEAPFAWSAGVYPE